MVEDNLKIYIDEFFENLNLYDDYYNRHNYKDILKASIEDFLENKTTHTAFEVYEMFFMIYQITFEDKSNSRLNVINSPNIPLDFVKLMLKYQNLIKTNHRDTFIYSVNVFILGLAIYSQNINYSQEFNSYILRSPYKKFFKIDDEFSHEEFLYRWGITSLLHEIALPLEMMGKPLKNLLNKEINSIFNNQEEKINLNLSNLKELNSISKIDNYFSDEYIRVYPSSKFLDMFKPTDLLSHKITIDFDLDSKQLSLLKNYINNKYIIGDCPCKDNPYNDYGLVSSIIILDLYGYLIQKYGKDPDFFFYPILDSASAVLLQNFYRNALQNDSSFKLSLMEPKNNPLAFLLILCKEILWDVSPDAKLNLLIDDNHLDIEYIVEGSSINSILTQDTKDLLNYQLMLKSLFSRDLHISTNVHQKNDVLREMVISEIQSPNVLLKYVEQLAIGMHIEYFKTIMAAEESEKIQRTKKASEEINGRLYTYTLMKDEIYLDFDSLPSHLKISNLNHARNISKELNIIGCELASLSDKREAVIMISNEELMDLAEYEHELWLEKKIGQGWTYGEEEDNENLISPSIVPWNETTPEIQAYDLDHIRNIPYLVNAIGLKIVRNKFLLLSFERYKFLNPKINAMCFEDLPKDIKYINYILINNLIKSLYELGYEVVDVEYAGEAVVLLDVDVVEYLAKRDHDKWCIINYALGWQYGANYDDELKINPNLVRWYDLNLKSREINIDSIRQLPKMCKKVDLKIVKK